MSSPALCPICCDPSARTLLSLEFSEKQHLPQRTDVNLCATCNFAFSSPRDAQAYDAFYGTNLNDTLGADASLTESEKRRYAGQIDALQCVLQQDRALQILDIGCGQAGLLRMMKARYPDNHYYAADPNVDATQKSDSGIQFSHTWKDLQQKFDLIILSHVVEHVVDFAELAPLPGLLSEDGHVYIEVPDASRYQSHARQEYLYYFDRLHINHFTHDALSALVASWGLAVGARGRSEFEYKDGQPYPAIHMLATKGAAVSQAPSAESLDDGLFAYLKSEAERSRVKRDALRAAGPIVVYGFGDNFFKAIGQDGPLSEAYIAAVIDRRHALLNQSPYASLYTFMDIDACCAQFPGATYVVAISWGGAQVRSELQRRGIQNIELI
jgi:SAM-dependent methyltransferase